MPHIIADLYHEQRALRDEAASIFAAAEASSSGAMTDDQSTRLDAIKSRNGRIDTLIDDAVAALDTIPDPSGGRARGLAEGRAAGLAQAHAEVVALLEVCAKADAKASVIFGFIKARKSAAEVETIFVAGREGGTELISRAGNHAPDKPASWEKAIAKVNQEFGR